MSEAPVRLREVHIREATPHDQKLLESLRSSVGWSTSETGLSAVKESRSIIYIVEVDKTPAAAGALVFSSDDPELADAASRVLISNLIVGPTYQRHGLGTRLLEHLEAEARTRGFSLVTIGVDVRNSGARLLYERHGYGPLKDKEEPWGPVNYLAKDLGAS